eukprot:CAMPEP_0204448360 /NCGR_PEP_ID=MMETSP0470-20130426/98242_1 /ASSEMBLY_ACC=CAM_ASM_000385 /TAXON_ID=2969 /ORGANISM="Oxyrrhis marina" /LENGTH=296 /DNA_ID=CAMNT_0051448101 /DNA_START=133 /DNA_END=1023 /DNA_ORIENTATION=+
MMHQFLARDLGLGSVQVEDFCQLRADSPSDVLQAFLQHPARNKLVYLSAHGEPSDGRLRFSWSDSQRSRSVEITPLSFGRTLGVVGLLVQSCYSGKWWDGGGRYFVVGTAGQANEKSWGGDRGGAWTRWLVGDLTNYLTAPPEKGGMGSTPRMTTSLRWSVRSTPSFSVGPGVSFPNDCDQHSRAVKLLQGGRSADLREAVLLLSAAEKSGHVPAKVALAEIYIEGLGLPRDFALAQRLCEEAASVGDAAAQYCLGRMHCEGLGTKKDMRKAVFCWKIAAAQGDPRAADALRGVQP